MTINDIIDLHEQKDGSFAEEEGRVHRVGQYMKDAFKPVSRAVATGLALIALSYAPEAKAVIILDDQNIQGQFESHTDNSKDGIEIKCAVSWVNLATVGDANNQISASGLYGEVDSGLYNIDTTDGTHFFTPPTYTFNPNSFYIQYANGVVNPAGGGIDTFTQYFNLGNISQEKANDVMQALNDAIAGTPFGDIENNNYILQSSINGLVSGGLPQSFENSPIAYVPNMQAIPEPMTIGLLGIGAVAGLAVRRVKENYKQS